MVSVKNLKNRKAALLARSRNATPESRAHVARSNLNPRTPLNNASRARSKLVKSKRKAIISNEQKEESDVIVREDKSDTAEDSPNLTREVSSTETAEQSPPCCCCCTRHVQSVDCVDSSVVGETLNMSKKGVRQLLNIIQNGTNELRDLVLNECEVILECRKCRQLFRSVHNFLIHKRQFCLEHCCESMVLFDPTSISYVETPVERSTVSSHEEEHRVEPEVEKIETINDAKKRTLEKCLTKLRQQNNEKTETVISLKLTAIHHNSNAVFQHAEKVSDSMSEAVTSSSSDLTKDTSHETAVHDEETIAEPDACAPKDGCVSMETDIGDGNKTVVEEHGPEEKITIETSEESPCTSSSGGQATCNQCGSSFISKKTLRVHLKTIHASQRLVYPCPFCQLTFKQLCNATRHLIHVHKKGKNDVKKLRESVKANARPIEEMPATAILELGDQASDLDMDENTRDSFCLEFEPMDTDKSPCALDKDTTVQREDSKEEQLLEDTSSSEEDSRDAFSRKLTEIERQRSLSDTNIEHIAAAQALFAKQQNINSTGSLKIDDKTQGELSEIMCAKKLKCTVCPSMSFTNVNHLTQHAVTHIGLAVLKCKGCEFKTLSRQELDDHLGSVHNIPEPQRPKLFVNLSAPFKSYPPPPPKLVDASSVVDNLNCDKPPPPLYDSKGTLLSSNAEPCSSVSGSPPSTGHTSPCGIKLVIHRQSSSSSLHSKRHKAIYAVTTRLEDRH
ncbi:putative zinc finger protein [Halotydeus destructor]|nr:putative zinc finger protein [Halotydeus destructor]